MELKSYQKKNLPIILFVAIEISRLFFLFWENTNSESLNIIGVASFEGVDVGIRIKQFYYTGIVFLIAFLGIQYLLNTFLKYFNSGRYYWKQLPRIAFWGILIQASLWMNNAMVVSLFFVKAILTLFIVLGILRHFQILKSNVKTSHILMHYLIVSGLLYLVRYSGALPGLTANFQIIPSLSFIILILLFVFAQRSSFLQRFLPYQNLLNQLAYLPFAIVFSFELNQIFIQKGMGVQPIIFPIAMMFIVFLLHLKPQQIKGREAIFKPVSAFWALALWIGLASAFNLNYIFNGELFETANLANPLMRFYAWGELPLLQQFSSHVLSDWIWPFFYTLINGYNLGDFSFFTYFQFQHLLNFIILFFVLKHLLKNTFWAFAFAAVFPFEWIAPYRYIMPLLSILLLHNYLLNTKKYAIHGLMIWSLFMLLWSMEIGVAHILSIFICGVILFFSKKTFKVDWLKFVKILGIHLSAWIVIWIVLCWVKDIPPFDPLKQIILYAGAAQAHGFEKIAEMQDRFYVLHYVFFPFFALFVLLFLFLIRNNIKVSHQKLWLACLYIFAFYLSNFQRGLVRHSLFAGYDVALDSLFYLGVLFFILFILKTKSTLNSQTYYKATAGLFLLILLAKFGDPESGNNRISEAILKIHSHLKTKDFLQKSSRSIVQGEIPQKLIYILKHKLGDDATFLDFSNNPTLYYLTGKKVPGYFNQPIQNIPLPEAQRKFVNDLKNENIELVLFSKIPPAWGDITDGVPSALRYFEIAEWIYKHYSPVGEVDGFWVWNRKDLVIDEILIHLNHFDNILADWNLKKYPSIMGANLRSELYNSPPLDFIKIKSDVHSNHMFLNAYFNGKVIAKFDFRYYSDKETYAIPLNYHPKIAQSGYDSLTLFNENGNQIQMEMIKF